MESVNNDEEQLQQLAYRLWKERGCPDGSPEEDWYAAQYKIQRQTQVLTNLLAPSQMPFASIKMGY